MSQQWLSVIGVGLDFAGFCILLVEWWFAFFNEERQLGFQRRLERERNLRAFAQANASGGLRQHLETTGKMMDDMAVKRAWDAHATALNRRKPVFIVAAVLIATGLVLQIVGSWPA